MDRRTFVKACVAVGGAGVLAAGGISLARAGLKPRPPEPVPLRYIGAQHVAGPAPRGVPYVPIALVDGEFVVKRHVRIGREDMDTFRWHRYCGRTDAPGLREDWRGDDKLRFALRPEHEDLVTPWWKPYAGQPARPEHFPEFGYGAAVMWRSDRVDDPQALPAILIRVDPARVASPQTTVGNAKPLPAGEMADVRREVFSGEFVCVSSVCTHFCATAGYKEAEAIARPRNAWENVFCTSHNASFDPTMPVSYPMVEEATPLP